jgi:acyl-CoA reductase-like NAD-dependent aldehyde dehydrogenase
MGPLISAEQHARVMGYIDIGKGEGAQVACGGARPAGLDKGYFVAPTVFAEVNPQMRIAREEIFGPVLSVMSFDDEEEAINIANGTEYGLAAGIFTADISRALRCASRIKAGTIHINEYSTGDIGSPFGGMKQSGIGREKGLATLANYTQIKNVIVRIGGV